MFSKRQPSSIDPSKGTVYFDEKETTVVDLSLSSLKFLFLCFAAFLCFGSYYAYGNPSALQTQLEDRLDMDAVEYNMLFAVYAFPNFVLPLFGGMLLDFMGIRIGVLVYASLVLAGQVIFAFAVSIKSYYIALIGRFVFGLGGENLNVAQSTVVSNWFVGKPLSFALGLNISVSRIGSVLNDYTEPEMNQLTGSPVFGLWIGAGICLFSLFCGVGVIWLDKLRDSNLGNGPLKRARLADLKRLNCRFWLVASNSMVVYVAIIGFNDNATQFFQERFNYSKVDSGFIVGITYVVAAVLCPIIGRVVDAVGRRTWFIALSSILATLVHLIFILLPDCDECVWGVLNLVLLGLCYSIYAAVMWACIPYVVPEQSVATAFGIATSLVNIGIGFGPLIVGVIKQSTTLQHGYFYVGVFFVAMGIIAVVTAVALIIVDRKRGGILDAVRPETLKEQEDALLLESLQDI